MLVAEASIEEMVVSLCAKLDELPTHEALIDRCDYAIRHVFAMIEQSQRERQEAAS